VISLLDLSPPPSNLVRMRLASAPLAVQQLPRRTRQHLCLGKHGDVCDAMRHSALWPWTRLFSGPRQG
jgi:hypothetical protein